MLFTSNKIFIGRLKIFITCSIYHVVAFTWGGKPTMNQLVLIFVLLLTGILAASRQQAHLEHLARRGTPKGVRPMPRELRRAISQRNAPSGLTEKTMDMLMRIQADTSKVSVQTLQMLVNAQMELSNMTDRTIEAMDQMCIDLESYLITKKEEAKVAVRNMAIRWVDGKVATLLVAAAIKAHLRELSPELIDAITAYLAGFTVSEMVSFKVTTDKILDESSLKAMSIFMAREFLPLIPPEHTQGIPTFILIGGLSFLFKHAIKKISG